MAPRRKRQKLTEDGAENVVPDLEEAPLNHAKGEQHSPADGDLNSRRSLFVRALPRKTTTEDLTTLFSQSFPIKHAVAVIDPATKECKGYGFVTFADTEDAQRALKELNGSDLHGSKIRVEVAEPRHRGEDGAIILKQKVGPKSRQSADSEEQQPPKLIIRNLPWSIDNPDKLSLLFRSYGKVNHAVIPKNAQGRMMGFGVVVIRGRKNAEKALAGVNGKEVDGRTLAVDWAVDKETWQNVQKAEVVREEAERSHLLEPNAGESDEMAVNSDAGPTEPTGGSDHSSDDEDWEMDEPSVKEDGKDGTPPLTPKPSTNDTTLFIRNLPFTCTDEDLQEHFEEFGPIRYARIVLDPNTERPRGTGFVCFYRKPDVDTCLKEAPHAIEKKASVKDKRDMSASAPHSVLQNEFADSTGKFTMDGRVLQVTRAVDKSEASRLTAEGVAYRNSRDKDKRRLYLLNEGTIPSNSPLYQKLSPSEIAMREASAKQRKALIESNPTLHLSLTRLSIRNIPRTITSKDLKALAREAIVGFAKDVKAGTRDRLSKEEVARGGEEMKAAERERKLKGKGLVKQAKIVFEGLEGGKVQEGAGRSRGYGFIEYHTHRSALMGLRWLNGHSIGYTATEKKGKKESKDDMQERKKRLIVEFAIENAQVVNRRKDLEIKSRDRSRSNAKNTRETAGESHSESTSNDGKRKLTAAKIRKGKSERLQTTSNQPSGSVSTDPKADKLAKRQKIIARKRMARKARKKDST